MAWIESYQSLANHPKTKRLARTLGISIPTVIGHLHLLWWWAMDYATDGDISKYGADEIADACSWNDDSGVWYESLIFARFVDRSEGTTVIHDWPDYNGKYKERRARHAEVVRASRAKHRESSDSHVTVTVASHDVLQTNKQTIQTNKEDKEESARVAKTKRAPTDNDRYLESFVESIGQRPSTKGEWAKWGKGVTEIRSAEPVVTLEEIPSIVERYRKRCPNLPINPAAIASHLSDYREAPLPSNHEPPFDFEAQQLLGEDPWAKYRAPRRSEPTAMNGTSSGPA